MDNRNKHTKGPPKDSGPVETALQGLNHAVGTLEQRPPIAFGDFLKRLVASPAIVMRNIFQVFHDMVTSYVGEGVEEYPDDPESIHFASYDCNRLFVHDVDHPFFADRLFANRLVNLVEYMKRGALFARMHL